MKNIVAFLIVIISILTFSSAVSGFSVTVSQDDSTASSTSGSNDFTFSYIAEDRNTLEQDVPESITSRFEKAHFDVKSETLFAFTDNYATYSAYTLDPSRNFVIDENVELTERFVTSDDKTTYEFSYNERSVATAITFPKDFASTYGSPQFDNGAVKFSDGISDGKYYLLPSGRFVDMTDSSYKGSTSFDGSNLVATTTYTDSSNQARALTLTYDDGNFRATDVDISSLDVVNTKTYSDDEVFLIERSTFTTQVLGLSDRLEAAVAVDGLDNTFSTSSGKIVDSNGKEKQLTSAQLKDHAPKLSAARNNAREIEDRIDLADAKKVIATQRVEEQSKKQKRIIEETYGIDTAGEKSLFLALTAVNEINKVYGVSALFIGKEELNRRMTEIQNNFEGLYLSEQFESAVCDDIRESPLVQNGGIGFVEILGDEDKIAVSIQGTKQEVVTFTNGTEYLYKITYIIRNKIPEEDPLSESWFYNVRLSGEKQVNLWDAVRIVKPSTSQTFTKSNAVVFYSEKEYSELCIQFSPMPAAMQTDRICNTFVSVDANPSAFELPFTQSSGSTTNTQQTENRDPQLNLDLL